MNKEFVVLVNEQDQDLGTMEKMEAHVKGVLHRAFSIFVFNSSGEMMIHRRALSKYHSPGMWTNTCCSHPRLGESLEKATHRRLMEEMGFDCGLKELFHFIYRADVGGDLIEHELDHVFIGKFNDSPAINPEEVDSYKMISISKLKEDMAKRPDEFTPWFKIAFKELDERLARGEIKL